MSVSCADKKSKMASTIWQSFKFKHTTDCGKLIFFTSQKLVVI